MITEIEAKLAEMEKAPEFAAIPEVMPEKVAEVAKASQSRANQQAGKDSEKSSVLKDLTAKREDQPKAGHGRKKPARSGESR